VAQSSFYGMPQPILDLCAELLRSGEAERIRQGVEKINLQRVHQAVNILGQWDIRWRSDVPFIWLRLPQGWRGSTFATACEARGIRIKPADEFALPDGAAPHAVRLALNAIVPQPQFEAGLKEIAAMLANPPPNVDL
jgi:DNA-binding transcriptional MocR family regulator